MKLQINKNKLDPKTAALEHRRNFVSEIFSDFCEATEFNWEGGEEDNPDVPREAFKLAVETVIRLEESPRREVFATYFETLTGLKDPKVLYCLHHEVMTSLKASAALSLLHHSPKIVLDLLESSSCEFWDFGTIEIDGEIVDYPECDMTEGLWRLVAELPSS